MNKEIEAPPVCKVQTVILVQPVRLVVEVLLVRRALWGFEDQLVSPEVPGWASWVNRNQGAILQLFNPLALKFPTVNKKRIFQSVGKIFCVEFHRKYLIHVLKDVWFIKKYSLVNVYSSVYSNADQRKHQSSASLTFVRGIHR